MTHSAKRVIGVSAALFAGCAALTVAWCGSRSAIDNAALCRIRAPTAAWLHDAAVFLVMWLAMTTAMMLPSLVPMLLRYRQSVGAAAMRLDALTARVGVGYFMVWTLFGVAAYATSVGLSIVQTRGHVMPLLSGIAMLLAGAMQFSVWKAHHLACCRSRPCCALPDCAAAAWRHGVRLGVHCVSCCLGFSAVLIVIGAMDLRAMTLVTIAISAERLAPAGLRTARSMGFVLVAAGAFLIARDMALSLT